MPKIVWLNGVISPLETASTSVADHAHLYGDGLFEGIRIYDSKVFKLDEHLERLYHGCRYLSFDMVHTHSELKAIILEVCNQAAIAEGYIRLNVTRGSGLGLDPRAVTTPPNVMVMVSTLALYKPEAYQTGLHTITCSLRVIPPDSLDPRVKCIGRYANNILAKAEANRAGAGEGIMLNHQGQVAEATGDNVFLIHKGVVRTPHPSCGVLLGVTRNTVIGLLRKDGYTVIEDVLTPFDVVSADEAFLTGTAAEVIPMISIDSKPIGTGEPGPVTRRAMTLFHEEIKVGTPFSTHAVRGS